MTLPCGVYCCAIQRCRAPGLVKVETVRINLPTKVREGVQNPWTVVDVEEVMTLAIILKIAGKEKHCGSGTKPRTFLSAWSMMSYATPCCCNVADSAITDAELPLRHVDEGPTLAEQSASDAHADVPKKSGISAPSCVKKGSAAAHLQAQHRRGKTVLARIAALHAHHRVDVEPGEGGDALDGKGPKRTAGPV
jgi:hypothetical protein